MLSLYLKGSMILCGVQKFRLLTFSFDSALYKLGEFFLQGIIFCDTRLIPAYF